MTLIYLIVFQHYDARVRVQSMMHAWLKNSLGRVTPRPEVSQTKQKHWKSNLINQLNENKQEQKPSIKP